MKESLQDVDTEMQGPSEEVSASRGAARLPGPLSDEQILAAEITAPKHKRIVRKNWTSDEDAALKRAVEQYGEGKWKAVASIVVSRTHTQCMQRWSKALRPGLKKGHWTAAEDQILSEMASKYNRNWAQVAKHIEHRTIKQIRERWTNHVDPSINHAPFTKDEDEILVKLHGELGNKWALIATHLDARTAEGVKIRWKSLHRKSTQALKRQAKEALRSKKTTPLLRFANFVLESQSNQLSSVHSPQPPVCQATATDSSSEAPERTSSSPKRPRRALCCDRSASNCQEHGEPNHMACSAFGHGLSNTSMLTQQVQEPITRQVQRRDYYHAHPTSACREMHAPGGVKVEKNIAQEPQQATQLPAGGCIGGVRGSLGGSNNIVGNAGRLSGDVSMCDGEICNGSDGDDTVVDSDDEDVFGEDLMKEVDTIIDAVQGMDDKSEAPTSHSQCTAASAIARRAVSNRPGMDPLTDSLQNLLLSDNLLFCPQDQSRDKSSDQDEEEAVVVVMRNKRGPSATTAHCSSMSSRPVSAQCPARPQLALADSASKPVVSQSHIQASARPNLLIRPPSFNLTASFNRACSLRNLLASLTSSPLATSGGNSSSTFPPGDIGCEDSSAQGNRSDSCVPHLERMGSSRSILSDDSCMSNVDFNQLGLDSPTCKDYEMLSQHLEKCDGFDEEKDASGQDTAQMNAPCAVPPGRSWFSSPGGSSPLARSAGRGKAPSLP